MILIENKIIQEAFINIRKNLSKLKLYASTRPKYVDIHNNLTDTYRELIGDQMWMHGNSYEFQEKITERILDLDSDLRKILLSIFNEDNVN